MKEELALRLLSQIMAWDDERSRKEFAWLSIMSRYKYDDYQDYLAGARFTESLLNWLQQFEQCDRETAYRFVRHRLVYVGAAELQHLVDLMYPETIRKQLVDSVATQLDIRPHQLWKHEDGRNAFQKALRKTLFLGLSDGARIDAFRRANAGIINNEQVMPSTHVDTSKWDSALKELRNDLLDPAALFESAYLIDDFVGSGTTLLREEHDDAPGEVQWKGKLIRFMKQIQQLNVTPFSRSWTLYVHHYLATHAAVQSIQMREEAARRHYGVEWFPRVVFSFGLIFPEDFPISEQDTSGFLEIMDRYYDPAIETTHSEVGKLGFRRGFAGCSLPLVLDHNTPNNSIALLWAESAGKGGSHAMRPLFRRRQRHL